MKTAAPRRAFGLIEVLVSIAVLAIGIYALADLLASSRHSAALLDGRIQGTALAQLKAAEIRASVDQIPSLLGDSQQVLYPKSGPVTVQQDPRYVWMASLKRLQDKPDRVQVDVYVMDQGTTTTPAGQAQTTVQLTRNGATK